jgi:integrase
MTDSLPAAMKVTDYMVGLAKDLMEKKGVTESTAGAYIRLLYCLNGKQPFKSLTFLKKTAEMDEKIAVYAESTQKNFYSAAASVLSLIKDKAGYKKAYTHYFDKMLEKANNAREGDSKQKSEREKENWVDWKDVQQKHTELKQKVAEFAKQKVLTASQWETLLHATVVALYTEMQPRRNQDYLELYVVRSKKPRKSKGEPALVISETEAVQLPKDKNYLLLDGKEPKQLIFNKFKTSKTYGQQILDVPEPLAASLKLYLAHHPLNKGNKKPSEFKLLVTMDGSPITAANSITRILNRVFGKRVGSSMLRHSFLSGKYGETLTEQEKDSAAMGHSVEEQRRYIRTDSEEGEE